MQEEFLTLFDIRHVKSVSSLVKSMDHIILNHVLDKL